MKVLYVDDEPDIREIAVLCLQLNPALNARSCEGGKQALQIAASWAPDVVLLDVMMPDMDGPMTRAALLEQPSTAPIPVIFVTARTQPSEVEKLNALGVRGIIAKPFDPMTLAREVCDLMGWPA